MRTFSLEDAAIALELEQFLVDYNEEVDFNGGANAPDYFWEDGVTQVGAIEFKGPAGVRKYYADRLAKVQADEPTGMRTTRHTFASLKISIANKDRATLKYLILTYAAGGAPPIMGSTMPVAISDARMECQRSADGKWRIKGLFGGPVYVSNDGLAQKILMGRKD